MRNLFGIVCTVVASFSHKAIEAWFFDKVVHQMNPYENFALQWGIPIGFAVLSIWLFLPEIKRRFGFAHKEGKSKMADEKYKVNAPGGIATFGQSGGTNTVIHGNVGRRLGDNEKSAFLSRLSKARPISVSVVMNDAEAAALADEITVFLRASGFRVDGPQHMMMWGPSGTPRGVHINTNDDKPTEPVQITVGINAPM